MSQLPDNLYYTQSHEWLSIDNDDQVTVGVTEYAQQQLGELVFVELPAVEDQVQVGDECCVLESVKAASDVYAPISGEVTQVNEDLFEQPEKVNESPYDNGWLFKLQLTDEEQLSQLLDHEQYQAVIDDEA